MAFDASLVNISIEAAADLSAKQYFLGAIDSSGQFALAGAGAQVDGVNQDEPDAAGKIMAMAISGVSKVSAGGTIAAGELVASDSAGEAVAAATGDNIAGVAMAAAVDGDIFPVLLKTQNANAIA